MEKSEYACPISVILNGANYIHWAQAMTNFLKARKVWRIVTRDIIEPVRKEGETLKKFNK